MNDDDRDQPVLPPLPPPAAAQRDADDIHAQLRRAFWDPHAPPADASESEDEENDPSSIANVFAEMLNVNEDMLMAAAECHADDDVEGTLAYQRILHRNLMEMANYIDSIYGVYSSSNNNAPPPSASSASAVTPVSSGSSADDAAQTQAQSADGVATSDTAEAPEDDHAGQDAMTAAAPDAPKSSLPDVCSTSTSTSSSAANTSTSSASKPTLLLQTLEAEEQLRVLKRSNKLWMKSRHIVREEESVSAIMNATAEKIAAIAMDARDSALELGTGITERIDDDEDEARRVQEQHAIQQALLNKIAISAAPPAPVLDVAAMHSQLSAMGLLGPLVPPGREEQHRQQPPAFPPELSMLFPPMLPPSHPLSAQVGALGLPWLVPPPTGPPLAIAVAEPRRQAMVPAPGPTARIPFERVCAACRKRHVSLHKCRIIHQHTEPEWDMAKPVTAPRKYTRRASPKPKAAGAAADKKAEQPAAAAVDVT